jgi:alcohol dehydrogenase
MKALVYHGPGQRTWETVPDPQLQDPTDAIVRIDTSTICGTDLHILQGDVPEVANGTLAYSAWSPSIRCPKIQPPPPVQRP